ncbi:type IV pilus assembly protein PilY1 [Halopseudomonas xinjiangensis]|uniref:Type IV pilus assembly protein PilY1 n=1 Tax=Halopseudomonas xinjiangensis TaxID=487184 RepID=A0A1H1W000_9GAMM|nr:PilC/PilY family type IV pilus protein [Halopseudomonas xinjiangensis]SDS89659.1 type IV pilus assembly protein PilY1 [Halopseudomonas xinjiangensis]
MLIPSSERPARLDRWVGLLTGVTLTLGCASAAQAFSPLSGPILANTAVPPNVVMLFDNSSSMVLNRVPGTGQTRLEVARHAAQELISGNRNVRFGLFMFRDTQGSGRNRDAPGGRLAVEVGSVAAGEEGGEERFARIQSTLEGVAPSAAESFTYTPLAETYYEVTRYMRGMRAFYPQSTSSGSRERFDSPVEYRCQRSFGLVLTDGLPTYDSQFPSSLQEDGDGDNLQVAGSFNLPDWDGESQGDSDGDDVSVEGSTFYLDDIAAFAYDTDLRSADGAPGLTDHAGVSFDDPQFPLQNMRTYAVGFAVDDPRLRSVAQAGNGNYYTATSSAELTAALDDALKEINAASGSGGGGISSAAELSADSSFYRTRYDPDGWTGAVEAYRLDEEGVLGQQLWSTDQTLRTTNRAQLYQTWRQADTTGRAGVVALDASTYGRLSQSQRRLIEHEASIAGLEGDGIGQQLLDWTRGTSVAGLRHRDVLLGDIIAAPLELASPTGVLAPPDEPGYAVYLAIKRREMTASLVTGANDGLVHVIGAVNGEHRYAFLPAAMHRHMGNRARLDFGPTHESGMDGPIILGDVETHDSWNTIAVGGMGAGGKGLFGLRLFDQIHGNSALGALWEVNADDEGWSDLGFTYAKPLLAKTGGRWVIITGNGYGGSSGQAVLYVLDAITGDQLKRLKVGEPGGNGLSTPQLVTDAGGNLVAAYAGDLTGRLWRFDLVGDLDDWSVGHAGVPMFTAHAGQPITVQPQIVAHPQGGHLLLFGTGKFLEASDLADRSTQAFYAVWDRPGGAGGLEADDLLGQTINEQRREDQSFRSVSQHRVDWHSQSGWMLPLVQGGVNTGERVTRDFITQGSRVIFTTGLIRDTGADPCVTTGDGWLMVLDIYSGGMLPSATIDTNGDRVVDGNDDPAAGVDLDIGLPGRLNLVRRPPEEPDCAEGEQCGCAGDDCPPPPDCGDEYYLLPGSDGITSVVGNSRCELSRIMWRQLM